MRFLFSGSPFELKYKMITKENELHLITNHASTLKIEKKASR
jgi:hypothetical protein